MINRQRLLRVVGLLAAGLCLFIVCFYLFIPMGRVNAVINQIMAAQGLTLSPGARKTILPGLVWKNLRLSSDQGVLIGCEQLKLQLRLLPLLTGRISLGAVAFIGHGQLGLEYGATGTDALRLHADDIGLTDIAFFKTVLGAKIGGNLWSEGSVMRSPKGLNGALKLEVRQLEFSGVKLGTFPLPDVAKLSSQGMVRVTNGAARLESFTLEGEGIFMRLSGDLPSGKNASNAPLNLLLEIMPKPEFLDRQKLVFLLLAKFMVSPGVYRVPIKGTLFKPQIL
jgi:type II secretion system protein N